MAGLYIDHGWNMGWCLVRKGGAITSGSVDFTNGNPTDGARLLAMTQWLTATLGQLHNAGEELTEIVYERITFTGKNSADVVHAHGKQLGNLERWAALKKQPVPRGIAWDVIKRHVAGRIVKREEMAGVLAERFTLNVRDADEASAVAVMLTAAARNKKQPPPEASPRAAARKSARPG